jgi:hypothetical protein
MDVARGGVLTVGGRAQLACDGVAEGTCEHSRFWIVRQGAKDSDVLVLRLPDGHTALPVFASEEEAGMFLWLETAEDGWRVAEISEADLAGLLRDSCAGVRRVVPSPPTARGRDRRAWTARTSCGRWRASGAAGANAGANAGAKGWGTSSHLVLPHGGEKVSGEEDVFETVLVDSKASNGRGRRTTHMRR